MKQVSKLMCALAMVATCISCSQDDGVLDSGDSSATSRQDSVVVALNLSGVYEDDLKAVGFDLNATGQPTATLEGQTSVAVLLLLKDGDGDVAQVPVNFVVTGKKTLSLMKPNHLTALPTTINTPPIHVRGIIGGSYSSATQRVTFTPPATTPATPAGGRATVDVPFISAWTELESSVANEYHAKSALAFRPQGMLLRLRVQRGSEGSAGPYLTIPHHQFMIRTTGFGVSGYYDVSTTGEPQWSFADGQTGVVMRRITLPVTRHAIAINTTTDYYVVWAMPTGVAATSTKTYIYPNPVNHVSNSSIAFWPERVGFASESKRAYTSGKTYHATAVLRPTMTNPLGQVAPRPMNVSGSDFMTAADWPVNTTNGIGFFTHAQALTLFNTSRTYPSGGTDLYHLPTNNELVGIMPYATSVGTTGISVSHEVLQVGSTSVLFTSEYKGDGVNTIYALRFQKYGGPARSEEDQLLSAMDDSRQMAYRYQRMGYGQPWVITARPLYETADKSLSDYLNSTYFYNPYFWSNPVGIEKKLYSYGVVQSNGARTLVGAHSNFISVQGNTIAFNETNIHANWNMQGNRVNALLFRDSY